MRVAIQQSTGLLIEAQSGGNPENEADLQVLIANAVAAGIPTDDVVASYVDDSELPGLIAAIPVPDPQPSQIDIIMDYIAAQPDAPAEIVSAVQSRTALKTR